MLSGQCPGPAVDDLVDRVKRVCVALKIPPADPRHLKLSPEDMMVVERYMCRAWIDNIICIEPDGMGGFKGYTILTKKEVDMSAVTVFLSAWSRAQAALFGEGLEGGIGFSTPLEISRDEEGNGFFTVETITMFRTQCMVSV